jgi:hypothetical protein
MPAKSTSKSSDKPTNSNYDTTIDIAKRPAPIEYVPGERIALGHSTGKKSYILPGVLKYNHIATPSAVAV